MTEIEEELVWTHMENTHTNSSILHIMLSSISYHRENYNQNEMLKDMIEN